VAIGLHGPGQQRSRALIGSPWTCLARLAEVLRCAGARLTLRLAVIPAARSSRASLRRAPASHAGGPMGWRRCRLGACLLERSPAPVPVAPDPSRRFGSPARGGGSPRWRSRSRPRK
jgi:hypothetical protein